MSIEFQLEHAHPAYREQIAEILLGLMKRFPFAKLRVVKLYEPKDGDRSLANVNEPGVIALNPYWFAEPPEKLAAAAVKRIIVPIGAGRSLLWHGTMVKEPLHVITHEFGHVVQSALPRAGDWSFEAWRQGTKTPFAAPSGYALVNDIEFFAESFAEYALGLAPPARAQEMAALVGRG